MSKMTGQFAKMTTKIGSAASVEIASLREWSVSIESEKIDATAAGDLWASNIRGIMSWEGEATCIDADPYWIDIATSGEVITIDFYDSADDAKPKYRGDAIVDFERTTPYDDVIEVSLTFTGNGPLIEGSTITTA